MSSAFRASFCFLVLSFHFAGQVLAWPEQAPSTPLTKQSDDEASLRSLAEAFFSAWASKDLDGFMRLWSAQSPELETRRKNTRKLFAESDRIEIRSLAIRTVGIDGDKARVRVEADALVIETGTGKKKDGYGKTLRNLHCAKESGVWKVWRETSAYDELAAALAGAGGRERESLLAEEKDLAGSQLARALFVWGARFTSQTNYQQALDMLHMARSMGEEFGDRPAIGASLNSIGNVHRYQGDYAKALEYYEKALAVFESMKDGRSIAMALGNIGVIHSKQDDLATALYYHRKSLAASEAAKDEIGVAITLGNIGVIHRKQGAYALALDHYRRSLAISKSFDDKEGVAQMLHNIGNIHRYLGDYAQALECHRQSLAIREEIGDRNGIPGSHIAIGIIRELQGDYASALEHFQKSLAMDEKSGDKEGIALTLCASGIVYRKQGRYSEALDFLERAGALARRIGAVEGFWESRFNAGLIYRAQNNLDQARAAFEEAIDVIETMRVQVAGAEQERQQFFENKLSPYHAIVDLLADRDNPTEALIGAERAKARALIDMLYNGRVNIVKAMTGQEQERERTLRADLISINVKLTSASQQDTPDQAELRELKSMRENARLSYEAFQTSLYAAHPELKSHRGEAPIINAEELAALLPNAASALLEYIVIDDRTLLFVVTKAAGKAEAEVRLYKLPIKREDLAKQTEAFRRRLAARDLGFRASAAGLYELLLKPAEAQLRGKNNLIIAPDDKLWDLPFQALLNGAGRFLIEDAAISYAPSLTALREMTKRRKNQDATSPHATLLALGNPRLGPETLSRASLALRAEKLDPLPEAEQEVKALRRLYGATRSNVYIGADARESLVKNEAGQATILHFATHGVLNDASPMYSHLALAQGDDEDGLLEAWELMRLDLKADLAVLSACETARGRFGAGEGMIGLTWALFVAGVPSTVVSQWKVESASSRDLMLGFHGLLQAPAPVKAKITKAEALRRAALKLMKNPETRHPFYWAGFVLVGAD